MRAAAVAAAGAAVLLAAQAAGRDAPPDGGNSFSETGRELPPEARRGADVEELAAVSEPRFLGEAEAGVWDWGDWRIVVAEDRLNCGKLLWCPWILLDTNGIVRISGTALERPRLGEEGALIWIGPDGRARRAEAQAGGADR